MDFTNRAHHFRDIHTGVFGKLYSLYLHDRGRMSYLQPQSIIEYSPLAELGSIDSILSSEADMLRDKLLNTSSAIISRLGINDYINYWLDYRSMQVYTQALDLEQSLTASYWGSSRQRSTLTSELGAIEKQKHDEMVRCWESLVEPMAYFVNLFHQYRGLNTDRRMITRE